MLHNLMCFVTRSGSCFTIVILMNGEVGIIISTVERLNKVHIGASHFVHYREAVLSICTVEPLNKGPANLSTI